MGSLKWGGITGYRPWLCTVISLRQVPTARHAEVLRAHWAGHVLVFTFGDHLFYWAPPSCLHNWIDKKAEFSSISKKGCRQTSKFFQIALKEANTAEARPGRERDHLYWYINLGSPHHWYRLTVNMHVTPSSIATPARHPLPGI